MSTSTKPEIGVSTVVGYVVSAATSVGALYAAIKGNDLDTVTSASAGITSLIITQVGRYKQAIELAKRVLPVVETVAKDVVAATSGANQVLIATGDEQAAQFDPVVQSNAGAVVAPEEGRVLFPEALKQPGASA